MPVLDSQRLIKERVAAIRAYHEQAGLPRAQLDVSGGVDSAVMLGLLAKALGPENITAVYSGIKSSMVSRMRAREVCMAFDVPLCEIDITPEFDILTEKMATALLVPFVGLTGYGEMMTTMTERNKALNDRIAADPTILGSIRSTLRAPIGRGMNRLAGGGIRHGTGNEDEDRFLRFYQKGGDGEVDTNPLGFLSKGEVYQLAVALGVPREIVECKPTPDLWGEGEAHNDEDELKALTGVGFTYSRVDYDTGEYTQVGTIERVSRFCDYSRWEEKIRPLGKLLFGPLPLNGWDRIMKAAAKSPMFADMDGDTVSHLLQAAREAEKVTRHKENPNIPMLGDRKTLHHLGILTDELPIL